MLLVKALKRTGCVLDVSVNLTTGVKENLPSRLLP